MPFWKSKNAGPQIGDFMWHLHCDGYSLMVARLDKPMPAHITFIKAHDATKAFRETHLRLVKPVRGPMSPACLEALAAYDSVAATLRKAIAACDKAKANQERATAFDQEATRAWARRITRGVAST